MASNGLLSSFLAAIQASLSVLLVISYGALAAHYGLLNSANGKVLSKVCVKIFLPALLFTKIGAELHDGSAHRYLVIPVWAFICNLVSFTIGIVVHLGLGFPDWTTAALMFNNTTSYPLLLIQSLQETGILKALVGQDESMSDGIERAKSYFLVFATVSSCLTFAVGPRLIDTEHSPDSPDDKDEEDEEAQNEDQVNEQTNLLHRRNRISSVVSTSFFPSAPRPMSDTPPRYPSTAYDRRPSKIFVTKKRWLELHPRAQWWLLFLFDFLNAPLLGAVVGAVIGLVPPLQRAFFSDTSNGGIFTAWLTTSLKNIGSIFVPLPLIVAGVSLYMSYQASRSAPAQSSEERTPVLVTVFVLVIRFIIWPVVSIAVIYALAKKTDVLGTDPMLWFALMLMPTGPPAMKLITMVQVSDADESEEHKIAKSLTVSYVISPILAFTVVGSLKAAQAAVS